MRLARLTLAWCVPFVLGPAMPCAAQTSAELPSGRTSEISAGWEGHEATRYGYVSGAFVFRTDRRDGWGVRAAGSFLYDRTLEQVGEATRRTPGLFVGAFYRRATERRYFSVGSGLDVRSETTWRGSLREKETQYGLAVQAFGLVQPDARSYLSGFAGFGSATDYVWARTTWMRQLGDGARTRAWHLGLELTGHGNDDVRGYSVGVAAEYAEVPDRFGAVRFSAGYARREFDSGRDDDRLYFGIGFYRNLAPRPTP